MPDTRSNLQVNQEGVEGNDTYDKSGWPTPLSDPSSQLKVKVTNGSNGESSYKTIMSTDGQDKLSLAEGKPTVNTGDMLDQGSHSDKFKTSQQQSSDAKHNPEPGDE